MDIKREIMAYFSDLFETRQRPDGSDFVCLPDNARGKIWQDIVMECHGSGSLLPDDFIYNTVAHLANVLSDCDSEEWENHLTETCDSMVDVYNHDLLAWVSSRISRSEYVENAVQEGLLGDSGDFDFFRALMAGQHAEIEEIAQTLISEIETLADDARPYVAGWFMCGFLPDNEPLTFETLEEAKDYIVEELEERENEAIALEDINADSEEDNGGAEKAKQQGDDYRKAAKEVGEQDGIFSIIVNGFCFFVEEYDGWIQDLEQGV